MRFYNPQLLTISYSIDLKTKLSAENKKKLLFTTSEKQQKMLRPLVRVTLTMTPRILSELQTYKGICISTIAQADNSAWYKNM